MKTPPATGAVDAAAGGAVAHRWCGGRGAAAHHADATFRRVVPWLLLAATALFAFGPQLRSMLAGGKPSTAKATVGVLAVAAYGGYFNGGLGILLLALFGLLGQTQLNAMNGLKNWVSALLTAIAVVIYAAGGVVQWPQALMMMVAATAGGYGGARVARRIPPLAARRHRGHRAGDGRAVLLAAVSRLQTKSGSSAYLASAGSYQI